MGMNFTAAQAILKNQYQGPIRNQLKKKSAIYDRIHKEAKNIVTGGLQAVIPILLGWPQGVGAAGDGKPLPTAGQSRYVDALVPIKSTYARIQWTGKSDRSSQGDKYAFTNAKKGEIANVMAMFVRDYNRSVARGTGVGTVATLTADAAQGATTITVDSTLDIYPTALMEIWTNPNVGTGTLGEIVQILAVTSKTTFTIAAPGLANAYAQANTIKLIRAGAKDQEIMGLSGLIDDGSNLVICQSIDRSAEILWRALVDDPGVSTVLTLDDLRKNSDESVKQGAVKLAYYTTFELRAAYLKICQEQKRFVNTMKFDKGMIAETITFDDVPIFVDEQFPAGYWDGVDEAQLEFQEQQPFVWVSPGGSTVMPISGFDMSESVGVVDNNMSIARCNTSFSMRNRVSV